MHAPSVSAVVREVALGLAVLLATLGAVTALALVLTPFDVEKPGKVARKLMVPLSIVLYLLAARIGFRRLPAVATLTPQPARTLATILTCFAAGVSALILLMLLQFLLGSRVFQMERTAIELLGRAVFHFAGSVCVLALLEESLFRGVLYHRLQKSGGPSVAILLGSAIFSAAHFLRPDGKGEPGISGVWEIIPGCLAGLANVAIRWPEAVGLFLVGLILAIIRHRTGSIHACIGVHGGWVWVRQMNSRVTDYVEPVVRENPLLYGGNRFYDGLLGWIALATTLALVWRFCPRPPRVSDAPGGP